MLILAEWCNANLKTSVHTIEPKTKPRWKSGWSVWFDLAMFYKKMCGKLGCNCWMNTITALMNWVNELKHINTVEDRRHWDIHELQQLWVRLHLPLASSHSLIWMQRQITIHQHELKTVHGKRSPHIIWRRQWAGLWVIRARMNVKGMQKGEKAGEWPVRDNGVAAFISLWIYMWDGRMGLKEERAHIWIRGKGEGTVLEGWVNRATQRSGRLTREKKTMSFDCLFKIDFL